MHPENHLAILAALTGFLLKTSVAFCVFWLLCKGIVSPRRKFAVWFGYLFLVACYWSWLLASLLPHSAAVSIPVSASLPAIASAPGAVGALHFQTFWATPLMFLLRGLGFTYCIILGAFLFLRIRKHLHLRWIFQFTYKPPAEIENIFRSIAGELGVGNVRLLMLSGIYSPATFGWIRPIVLLPPVCAEQSESELSNIFSHELQHIRRRDYVFTGIASLCRSLLFFHPAAWYAMRNLNLQSELACDLAVVGNSPERRATYAECLLTFARLRIDSQPTPWNLDFAGTSSQLKVRIHSILADAKTIPGWIIGLRVALGALLVAGFIGAAPSLSVAFSYEQPPNAAPVSSFIPAPQPELRVRHRATANMKLHKSAQTRDALIQDFETPTVTTTANAEPLPSTPAKPLRSTVSDPVLFRRGDPHAAKPSSPAGKVILLSTDSQQSGSSIAQGASVVSAITTGASEAVHAASHDRGKIDH